MLGGKKILLGITGSIAAYKSILLTRLLVKAGAEVRIILTPSAKDFVTPLTLSTLSKNPVLTDLFDEQSWANHALLGRWADLMIIAPLSCNSLAKIATGQCDNLLIAVYLSAACPMLVAPAMDEDMWNHPATKKNLETIASFGNRIIPVTRGELASGLNGEGRMAEADDIFSHVADFFSAKQSLKGKKVLVTAGPTYEPIDPVRFIGNHSSGKMGMAIARELCDRGAAVTVVMGPVSIAFNETGMKIIRVATAEEMYKACMRVFGKTDLAVMTAAVADYAPAKKADEKIKKHDEILNLELKRTKDILGSLGRLKKKDQVLVGFALETQNEKEHAMAKLKNKHADMIVLNSLRDKGAGFGGDTNQVTVVAKNGKFTEFPLQSKEATARDIVNLIIKNHYAK
jgi:phosphopantothenoylcysteine decarboxylase / phosphopantothenate---cysteine ligase